MENDIRTEILRIIQSAELTYEESLKPENRKELGYPYVAGYANSALRNIKELLEGVK